MATKNDVENVDNFDNVSATTRKLLVDALATRLASVVRAGKGTSNEVIAAEFKKEENAIRALIARFS